MTIKIDKEIRKRPYTKPEIREVRFVPEEVVFSACKASSFSLGPKGNFCNNNNRCQYQGGS
jgi:hypothetical protein